MPPFTSEHLVRAWTSPRTYPIHPGTGTKIGSIVGERVQLKSSARKKGHPSKSYSRLSQLHLGVPVGSGLKRLGSATLSGMIG